MRSICETTGESIRAPELAYAEAAYTPGRRHRRPESECRHSRKFRTFAAMGERLAHRDPSMDISPMHGWQHNTPQELRKREADPAMARFEDPEYRADQPLRWDEECIRFTSHTKRAFIFGMARALGVVGIFWILPVIIIGTAGLAGMDASNARYGGWVSNFFNFFDLFFPTLFFLIFIVLWGGHC